MTWLLIFILAVSLCDWRTRRIQQRTTRQGKMVFEIVASEVDFLRTIEWETGKRVRDDLVQRGLLRPSHRDEDNGGGGLADYTDIYKELGSAIPEDLIDDERA